MSVGGCRYNDDDCIENKRGIHALNVGKWMVREMKGKVCAYVRDWLDEWMGGWMD